jgi:F0F1-type ATP synthase membrane subunit b/b'
VKEALKQAEEALKQAEEALKQAEEALKQAEEEHLLLKIALGCTVRKRYGSYW